MRLPALYTIFGLALVCSAQTDKYLLMKFDWKPTTCMDTKELCVRAPFEAFTTYELKLYDPLKLVDDRYCPTTVANASESILSMILPTTQRQLDCVFADSGAVDNSQNYVLWDTAWKSVGSCTGLEPRDYFTRITDSYNKYNPNVVMKEYSVAPPTVDRDAFLSKLQAKYRKKAWIECDAATKNLRTVVVCMSSSRPYEQVDCPFDPLNPGPLSNGLPCQGTLNLPVATSSPPAAKVPEECVPYVKPHYITSAAASASAPPEGSSVPIAAIVGGVVGGLALVAAVAIGILLARRKRNRHGGRSAGGPYPAVNGVNGINGASGVSPYTYNRPHGGFDPTFASAPPPGSMAAMGAAAAADPLLQHISNALSGTSKASRGSLKSWELLFEDITIERPIGEGSWGRVYKGTYHQTHVAVKVLLENTSDADANTQSTLVSTNGTVMARLEQEAALMSNLHHPNIVHLLGICIYPAAIVTEYCTRGSLTAVLSAARANPKRAAELTWPRRISMAADCCRGMLYLHSRRSPIIHRDLKSANLLVTASWKLKVSDFNLSKIMEDTSRSSSMGALNPRWLAPEVLGGAAATLASDVFAMGVILWEMMTWELPWGTSNPWGIVKQINAGNRPPIPAAADMPGPSSGNWDKLDAYIALMNRCWSQNPEDRPNFGQIMADLRALDPSAVEADIP